MMPMTLLMARKLAPPRIPVVAERNAALAANMRDGAVGGLRRDQLDNETARNSAYASLVQAGLAKPSPTADEQGEGGVSPCLL